MRVFCWLMLSLALSSTVQATQCTQLVAGGVPQYPPYSWVSPTEDGQMHGAFVEMMARISTQLGIPINVIHAGSWARAQAELAQGRLDLMMGIFYTEERANIMDYLQPAMHENHTRAWIAADSQVQINRLSDLSRYRGVAIIRYSFGEEFDQYARENLTIDRVNTIEQGIKMVENHRVDYLLYEELPGNSYLDKNGSSLRMLPLSISEEKIYLAISKKSACNTQELQQKIQAILLQAKQENWLSSMLLKSQQHWQTEQKN